MTIPVILDTDIGTDVDDCLALAVLLGSPEVELAGITTVYGDVALRGRMAAQLLRLRGRAGVPVAPGVREPLQPLGPVYWEGHEGEGLLTAEDAELPLSPVHAVDLIIETARARPGQVHLVAVGALTNVALALRQRPALAAELAGITIMGGAVGGSGRLHLPWVEHNFWCDPLAARIVIDSGARLRIVPLDVTTLVRFGAADVARIRGQDTPFHCAVADQVERYPRYRQRGDWTFLHDPLAAATLIRPHLVSWTPVHARVETGGTYSAGRLVVQGAGPDLPADAEVALDVDTDAAHDFIVERLLG
jgi:purine nucleosidase